MSEDGYPLFHPAGTDGAGAGRPAVTVIAADDLSAALVEAAGWPQDRIALAGAGATTPLATIHVIDWRCEIANPGSLDALPSDCAILCLCSLETLDLADALLGGRLARFVVGDAPALIATELSELSVLLQTRGAHDGSSDERKRLQALAMDLARLAEQLGALSISSSADKNDRLADRNAAYSAEKISDQATVVPPDPRLIRNLIAIRRLRDSFFDAGLFADPAWDILLDLAASRLEGRPVSVSSLCIAAAVPPTTALRWIRMMTDQALLERRADPADARRIFIDLSDAAFDQLCKWFSLVERRGGFGA